MSEGAFGDLPRARASTLVQQVHDELRQRIFDGRLPPGADVPDSVIAKQMGVSRAPVRDACNLLVQAGLLTKRQNHPFRVRLWALDDTGDLNLIRWGYEAAAVRRLVQLHRAPSDVEAPLAAMDDALERGDAAASFRADFDFHFALVGSSGVDELTRLHRRIGERLLLVPLPAELPAFILERQRSRHQEILDVLAACRRVGDPTDVIRLLGRHILGTRSPAEQEDRPGG